jgi:hypothetical protein
MMIKSLKFLYFCCFSATFFGLVACNQEGRGNFPKAYGMVDNIRVICNDELWKEAVGDTFRYYFSALFPVTPQPEPLYDLHQVAPESFNQVMRTHRTVVILADMSDSTSSGAKLIRQSLKAEDIRRIFTDPTYRIAFHNDRWASNQLVLYWFAPNRAELAQSISKHYKTVTQAIQKHDNKTLTELVYGVGLNADATNLLRERFQIELKIPREYVVAIRDSSDGVWLRYETPKMSGSIFVKSLPGTTELSPSALKIARNELSKKYFISEEKGAFMEIDDRILPVVYQVLTVNGQSAFQGRGIWKMVNDFMGGSFVTYLIKDEKNNRVLLLDGFIHLPNEKKRFEMRRLDMILATCKLL